MLQRKLRLLLLMIDNRLFLISFRTFVQSVSLITSSPSLTVSDAVLSALQYGIVDVVSVNQTFNLSAIIVDKISSIQIGNIQWGSFTWTAAATLYTDIQYRSSGSLIAGNTSAVIVDTTGGTISVVNLAINQTGMYVIKLLLTSSNNVYSIPLTSYAILVKKSTGKKIFLLTFEKKI